MIAICAACHRHYDARYSSVDCPHERFALPPEPFPDSRNTLEWQEATWDTSHAHPPRTCPPPQTLKAQLIANYTAELRMLEAQLETLGERRALLQSVLQELEGLSPEVVEAIVQGRI